MYVVNAHLNKLPVKFSVCVYEDISSFHETLLGHFLSYDRDYS